MRVRCKLALLGIGTRLFQVWCMDRHPVGHPIEAVKYHGFKFFNAWGRSL